jgi:hypothetical protein
VAERANNTAPGAIIGGVLGALVGSGLAGGYDRAGGGVRGRRCLSHRRRGRSAVPRAITRTARLATSYDPAPGSFIRVRSTAAAWSMSRLLIMIRGFGTAITGFIGHIRTLAIGIGLIGADLEVEATTESRIHISPFEGGNER